MQMRTGVCVNLVHALLALSLLFADGTKLHLRNVTIKLERLSVIRAPVELITLFKSIQQKQKGGDETISIEEIKEDINEKESKENVPSNRLELPKDQGISYFKSTFKPVNIASSTKTKIKAFFTTTPMAHREEKAEENASYEYVDDSDDDDSSEEDNSDYEYYSEEESDSEDEDSDEDSSESSYKSATSSSYSDDSSSSG